MDYTIQTPAQLSSHLRALRRAKGLSQAALGSRLGLSQARVARIEGDPLSISVEQLLRVFAALGVRMGLESLPASSGVANLVAPAGILTATGSANEASTKPYGAGQDGDW